jgi:hypothetical protein
MSNNKQKLDVILKLHKMWFNDEDGGQRANLIGENLINADLKGAFLKGADLSDADLSGADLSGANLYSARLYNTDLSGANLSDATLINADLKCANLSGANLSGAKLIDADLRGVQLINADLKGATLPMYCYWHHGIIDGKIEIGCEIKTIEEWEAFLNSDMVIRTPRNTPKFKQIEAVIRAYIAYLTTLNSD